MRISDWSSDVCSSDLARIDPLRRPGRGFGRHAQDHPLRPAAQAQPRRDGEGRGRTGRRPQAEGVAVMAKVLIVAEPLDGTLNAATAKCESAAKGMSTDAHDNVVLAAGPAAVPAPRAHRSSTRSAGNKSCPTAATPEGSPG